MADRNSLRFVASVEDKVSSELAKLRDKFDLLGKGAANSTFIGVAGAKAMGAAFGLARQAVGAATDFIGGSIEAASRLNETLSKSKVIFGDAAGAIETWGEGAAQSMGMSKQAAIEAAASLGNLLKQTGAAPKDLAPMSQALVQLAGDLSSFNNIPTDVALQKLQSGLVGEYESLRSLGVALSGASVDAQALVMGFKKVNGTFTEGEKIQARYALVFKATSAAQGDFIRTGDQLANSQRKVAAEMVNAQAKIGDQMLPAVTKLEVFLANEFIPTAMDTVDVLSTLGSKVLSPLGNVVDFVDAQIVTLAVTTIKLNDAIGGIPGPWHEAEAAMTGTSAAAGKAHDDVAFVASGMTGFAGQIGKAADDITAHTDEWSANFKDRTGEAIRQSNRVATALVNDAQAILNGYFEPVAVRADLFDRQQEALNLLEVLRLAKGKVAHRQARDDIIANLQDQATSLGKLGTQHQLTDAEVATYKKNVTAAYKAMGKTVPDEVMKGIDKLRVLASFNGKTVTIGVLVKYKETGWKGHAPGTGPLEYAEGGVVPGPKGSPHIAIVHGGETVVPAGQSLSTLGLPGGGGGITLNVDIGSFYGTEENIREVSRQLGELVRYSTLRRAS